MQLPPLDSLPFDDPNYADQQHSALAKGKPVFADPLEAILLNDFDQLSQLADQSGIQDSVAIRNVAMTRQLAQILINERGEIEQDKVEKGRSILQKNLYALGPDRQFDARRRIHTLNVLIILQEDKETVRFLKNIGRPPSNRLIDQLIRLTLQLPEHAPLGDAEARRAVLAAWLCYLRQTVGSCFATAPAIIVQGEQPQQFLQDLNELFATGRLKRTFGGIEHAVPLSISWGAGDLKKGVIFRGEEGFNASKLWLSPGLLAALETGGLMSSELSMEAKTLHLKNLLENFFKEFLSRNETVVTNSQQIIEGLLLRHFSLSHKEAQEYRKRKETPFVGGLLSASSKVSNGKEKALVQFTANLEKMQDHFKLLTECPLLKAWEFTLASFAETKAQFTTWNLYTSLGLKPDQPGGIGHAIFLSLKDRFDQANRQIQDLQLEYEQMYGQVSYLQGRLQRASTEKEIQWLKIEYQTRSHEFRMLEEQRDKAHHKAQRISGLFEVIIDQLLELFPRFFQEVYDADLHEVQTGPYDDSPAGFRLIYKHGRSNTAQWTYIDSAEEFIEALYSFFTLIERDLASQSEFTALEQELSDVITAITKQIRTHEFLETAFERMAIYHKAPRVANPLENLEKISKKPWAYTSGGTMGSLVSNYYRLEELPKEVSRWVENGMELMVFFIDSIKQIPPKELGDFIKEKRSSILTHSPTHAFLLKPLLPHYQAAWKNDAFTYTWVRDQIVLPMMRRVDDIHLDRPQMGYLIRKIQELIPPDNRFYFGKVFAQFPYEFTAVEFREYLFKQMEGEKGLQIGGRIVLEEQVDQLLYKTLPLVHRSNLSKVIQEIFSVEKTLSNKIKKGALVTFENLATVLGNEEYITSNQLLKICKILIAMHSKLTYWPNDLHESLLMAMREQGYALGAPFIIADTNWMRDDFGFVVSPGTGRVEFWRLDPYGGEGSPINSWNQWLDGSHQEPQWGLYNQPRQYYSS